MDEKGFKLTYQKYWQAIKAFTDNGPCNRPEYKALVQQIKVLRLEALVFDISLPSLSPWKPTTIGDLIKEQLEKGNIERVNWAKKYLNA